MKNTGGGNSENTTGNKVENLAENVPEDETTKLTENTMENSSKNMSKDTTDALLRNQPGIVEEWLIMSDIPTHVLKCGEVKPTEPLILIIPGNPGVPEFYEDFMLALYDEFGGRVPVWCISHAGHVAIPSHIEHTSTAGDTFSLEGQIEHKLTYVNEKVPANSGLILIGHSIGAQICLKIMKNVPPERILHAALLFPTIEHMSKTPRGRITTPLLRYFHWTLPFLAYPLYYLIPSRLHQLIMRFHFRNQNVSPCTLKASMNLVVPLCIFNVMYMTQTEMESVLDADHDTIMKNIDKLLFYYGTTDHWCPLECYHGMKSRHPSADVHLCEEGFPHAFVLEHSRGMSDVLTKLLKKKLVNNFPV